MSLFIDYLYYLVYEFILYSIISGFNLFKTFFENVNLCDHRLKRQGAQLVSILFSNLDNLDNLVKFYIQQKTYYN